LKIGRKAEEIATLEIDPTMRMADVDRKNNKVDADAASKPYQDPTK
jgi:hypothetical protein